MSQSRIARNQFLSSVLKAAWNLVKSTGASLSRALKAAWATAKGPKTIDGLVAAIKAGTGLDAKLWEKGEMVRLYIQGVGFQTKKTSQKLWLDVKTLTLFAKTDCPSQDYNWETSQSAILVQNKIAIQTIARQYFA